MKKVKLSTLALWIVFLMASAVLVLGIYMIDTKKSLYLFEYVFDENIIRLIGLSMLYIYFIISYFRSRSTMSKKKFITLNVILTAFVIMGIVTTVLDIHSSVKRQIASDKISLSDGNEIFLAENETKEDSEVKKREIYVYSLNGCFVKKIGNINELYFSNKCIQQDKYSYKYGESTGKLVITCEYGSFGNDIVSLKEEYDDGFLDYEFTIEKN